jgi:hypothetical protein
MLAAAAGKFSKISLRRRLGNFQNFRCLSGDGCIFSEKIGGV